MSKKTHEAVYNILSNDGNITALVGSKIFPTFIPEDQNFPALIYRITEKNPQETKDGVFGSLDTLLLEVYSTQAENCIDIADTIRTAIDRYRGTAASVVIDRIRFEGSTDEVLIPELMLYHLSQQYEIRVKY